MSKDQPLYLQKDYIDQKIKISMLWVNGKPTHDHIYDECNADFSCCNPELFEQDQDLRIYCHTKFVKDLLERRRSATAG